MMGVIGGFFVTVRAIFARHISPFMHRCNRPVQAGLAVASPAKENMVGLFERCRRGKGQCKMTAEGHGCTQCALEMAGGGLKTLVY
jgi:hypothetical protein